MYEATPSSGDAGTVLTGQLVACGPYRQHEREEAALGFVARYKGTTRQEYAKVLEQFFAWCDRIRVGVFDIRRAHIELFLRELEEVRQQKPATMAHKLSVISGFYKFAVADGFCETSPVLLVRRPRIPRRSTSNAINAFLMRKLVRAAEETGVHEHALICLLGLSGMRVSGACGLLIEDLGFDAGYTTATIRLKGGDYLTVSLSQPTAWAVSNARGDREVGRLLLKPSGEPMDRVYALRLVKRLARKAEINKCISPHSLRHAFVTIALDAGVPARDVMLSTGHPSIPEWSRTTTIAVKRYITTRPMASPPGSTAPTEAMPTERGPPGSTARRRVGAPTGSLSPETASFRRPKRSHPASKSGPGRHRWRATGRTSCRPPLSTGPRGRGPLGRREGLASDRRPACRTSGEDCALWRRARGLGSGERFAG